MSGKIGSAHPASWLDVWIAFIMLVGVIAVVAAEVEGAIAACAQASEEGERE